MSDRQLDEVEFAIFDTETTGLDAEGGDRIVEIAGIRVRGEKVIGEFESLLNPGRPVSSGAFGVHGISDEELSRAPQARDILPAFLDFLRGAVLCSYNAPFDLSFLNAELELLGEKGMACGITLDILTMARRLLPGRERYALWSVADALGIRQEQHHRARSDVELTWKVFRAFCAMLKQRGLSDIDKIAALFAFKNESVHEKRRAAIAMIEEAMSRSARLKIEYLSSSGIKLTTRLVVPREIRQREYLVGYCSLRGEERTFRIDGILRMEIL